MPGFTRASVQRLWRYYQTGIVNTVFGYATYALLVSTGMNMFVAQVIAQVLAVTFNYFSYSRHVFTGASASKLRFVLAYALNYAVSLASLAAAATFIASPYLAGLLALLFASIVNFIVLRRFVFTDTVTASAAPLSAAGRDR